MDLGHTNITSPGSLTTQVLEHLPRLCWHEAVLLLVLALVTRVVYNVYFHPLRKVPGPFLAKVTELWRTNKYAQGRWHEDIVDLHEQYGPVVRISPNEVSFIDQAALEQVYGHSTGTKKTSWYDTWTLRSAGTGLFHATDVREHAFLRKRVAVAYSKSTIATQDARIQKVFNLLWTRFHEISETGKQIDLQRWANYLAFDVVGQLGIGGTIGFIENGDATGIMRSLHGYFYTQSVFGYLPTQMRWTQHPLFKAIASCVGAVPAFVVFQEWMAKQIQGRIDEGQHKDRPKDMLDHFIAMREPDGQSARWPSIAIEVGNLIGAGADTTAIGITVVMAQLMLHPEDWGRVKAEVDQAYEAAGTSDQETVGLCLQLVEKLPFLKACIQEATRLCPSITWQLPREAPKAGITIAGYYLPRSATLSINPIAHNRSKEIFGEDAAEWRPQRWLPEEGQGEGSKSEYLRRIEKYNVTFGYGSRVCLGRHLAMTEIFKFVSQFVRQFDCELVNKANPFQRRSQWFCLQENFWVQLRKRHHDVTTTASG